MTTLQDDLLEIYNSLVGFSKKTLEGPFPLPIKVSYEGQSHILAFEQMGTSSFLITPTYYCLGLEELKKPTYLLPHDYDYLMSTLQFLIGSGELIKPRTILSPENYGFDIYATDPKILSKGPSVLGQIRFVSGTSWLFRYLTKRKYKRYGI